MSEELSHLRSEMNTVNRAVFGDRDNPKEVPGLLSDVALMGVAQARTNEILLELRTDLRKINWMIISGFVGALIVIVFKSAGH